MSLFSANVASAHVVQVPCSFAPKGKLHEVILLVGHNEQILYMNSTCGKKHGSDAVREMNANDCCFRPIQYIMNFIQYKHKFKVGHSEFIGYHHKDLSAALVKAYFHEVVDRLIKHITTTERSRDLSTFLKVHNFKNPLTDLARSVAGHALIHVTTENNYIDVRVGTQHTSSFSHAVATRYFSGDWIFDSKSAPELYIPGTVVNSTLKASLNTTSTYARNYLPLFSNDADVCDVCAMTFKRDDKHKDSERHRTTLDASVKRALRALSKQGLLYYKKNKSITQFQMDITALQQAHRVQYFIRTRPDPFTNPRFAEMYEEFPNIAINDLSLHYAVPVHYAKQLITHHKTRRYGKDV